MNKCVNKLLPSNTKIKAAFKSTRLSSCFNVKDKIGFEDNHDLIYHTKCAEPTSIDDYVGESTRRIIERIKDNNRRDHTSNVLKHSMEKSHKNVNTIYLIRIFKLLIRIFIIINENGKLSKRYGPKT